MCALECPPAGAAVAAPAGRQAQLMPSARFGNIRLEFVHAALQVARSHDYLLCAPAAHETASIFGYLPNGWMGFPDCRERAASSRTTD